MTTPPFLSLTLTLLWPSVNRLEYLTSQPQPFFLTIAPGLPHEQYGCLALAPPLRHKGKFPNAKAPRRANWNPADVRQQHKSQLDEAAPAPDAAVDRFWQLAL